MSSALWCYKVPVQHIDAPPVVVPTEPPASTQVHPAWQLVRFGLHLAAVYLTVNFCSIWLAGRFHDWVLPLVDPGNSTSMFQFVFSHLFAFTFIPALAVGLINAKYRNKAALFVWTVPTIILAYKFITFPTSVFQNRFEAAFHYFFAGSFLIGEFHNFTELFSVVAANPDAIRGMDQFALYRSLLRCIGIQFCHSDCPASAPTKSAAVVSKP